MDTLLTIQNRLSALAKNVNISGPVVEGLISLLSESIYRGQIGNVTELLEGSFSRCRLLNSAITHAADRGHSVFRGKNQMFILKGVASIESKKVKKFDVATEVAGYKLVYANDYTFESGKTISDQGENPVILILCNNVKEKNVTITEGESVIRTNFLFDNISEHIEIFKDDNRAAYTSDFSEAVRGIPEKMDETETLVVYPYWVCTRENFGVSVINLSQKNNIKGTRLTLKYLEYLDEDIDTSLITSIPGFIAKTYTENNISKVGEYTTEFSQDNITSVKHVQRDSTVSKIYKDAVTTYTLNGMLRSYNDIANLVAKEFGDLINSISVRFDFTSEEDNPKILISYSNRPGCDFYDSMSSSLRIGKKDDGTPDVLYQKHENQPDEVIAFSVKDFQSMLRNAYYIQEKVYFVKPFELDFPSQSDIHNNIVGSNTDDKEWATNKFKIKVYFDSDDFPGEEVINTVEEFRTTFQANVNLSRLIAKIQDIEGVRFAELLVTTKDGAVEKEFPPISVDLKDYNLEGEIPRRKILKTTFEYEECNFTEYLNKM